MYFNQLKISITFWKEKKISMKVYITYFMRCNVLYFIIYIRLALYSVNKAIKVHLVSLVYLVYKHAKNVNKSKNHCSPVKVESKKQESKRPSAGIGLGSLHRFLGSSHVPSIIILGRCRGCVDGPPTYDTPPIHTH